VTLQLGSIVLNDGMVWEDEFAYAGISQSLKTTLGGVPAIFSAPYLGPISISLRSLSDQGWQTYATVKALQSIARTLDGQFTLTMGSKSFIVAFRHYEGQVVEATPLTPKTIYDDGDYFLVSLKLVSYTDF
jgi:hypothetical protein